MKTTRARLASVVIGVIVGVVALMTSLLWAMGLSAAFLRATPGLASDDNAQHAELVGRWEPRLSDAATLERSLREVVSGDRMPPECPRLERYAWGDPKVIVVDRIECRSPYEAYDLANNYAGDPADLNIPPRGSNVVHALLDEEVAQLTWRERKVVLVLRVSCDEMGSDCREVGLALARQLANITSAVQTEDPRPRWETVVLAVPLVAWLLFVGPSRLATRLRQRRWESTSAPPRYTDVTDTIKQRSRRLRLRTVLLVVGWTCVTLGATGFITQSIPAIALLPLGASILVIARRLARFKVLQKRSQVARGGLRGSIGSALRISAAVLFTGILVTYIVSVIVTIGVSSGYLLRDVLYSNISETHLIEDIFGLGRWFTSFLTAGLIDTPEVWIILILVPTSIVAWFLNRLGERLRMAELDDVLKYDHRPPILYLRGFDEDRLRIPSPELRIGIRDRIVPLRRRRFEEVLAATLAEFGPVIAVAHPQTRLAELGAAKTILPQHDWVGVVKQKMRESFAVAMSATPSEIREGLQQELKLISDQTQTGLLLIVAPWPPAKLTTRWEGFVAYVKRYAFFQPLDQSWVQPGTHVLSYTSHRGWRAWGAKRRSDSSYVVAIREAVRGSVDEWEGEHGSVEVAKVNRGEDAR